MAIFIGKACCGSHSAAIFAVARGLAQHIYRMLRHGQDYVDIGQEAYEAQFTSRKIAGITAAARDLGYHLVRIQEDAMGLVSG